MELEIKISELTEAIERTENNGRRFNSFEEELEYVNQKYKAKYIQHCADVEQEWLNSDEYVPDDLVRKGFAYGVLDIDGMKQRVLSWQLAQK